MGVNHSTRIANVPFYARIAQPERLISGFLTVIVRNANDGNEATDDFVTRFDQNFSNAQTRNMDNYAPFDAQDPGASNFAANLNSDNNILLEENGGSNSENSNFTNNIGNWVALLGTETVSHYTGGGVARLQVVNASTSGNHGVKLSRSDTIGTTGVEASKFVWRTKSGQRYKLKMKGWKGTFLTTTKQFHFKVIFTNSESYTSPGFNASAFSGGATQEFDFTVPPDAILDEIQVYVVDPNTSGGQVCFDIDDVELIPIISKSRVDFGQSIGDYDVLVYHVTSACHMKNFLQPYKQDGTAGYYTAGELSNYPDQSESTWAKYIDHPACQNFVKFTLISRHNNAYDHQTWNSSPVYLETETAETDDKSVHIFERDGTNTANYWNYGTPATIQNDDYNSSMIDMDEYILKDSSNINTIAADVSDGIIRRRKQIFSTASASYVDPGSLVRTTGSMGADLRSGTAHVGTKKDYGNNTFFAPVHGVDIFASHPFTLSKYPDGSISLQNHADYGQLVRVTNHDVTFWQLVVNVKLLVFNSAAGITTSNDYEFFKNRININYQPSGETQNIIFDTSLHGT
jgi:hypothetical protein